MRCDAPASTRTSLRSVKSSFAEIVRRTHRDRMHDSPRARHAAQLLAVLWTSPDVHNMWGDVALVMELAAGGGLFDRLVSAGAYTEQLASTITRQVQSPGE